MRIHGVFFVFLFCLLCGEAQVSELDPPVRLDLLIDGLGNPKLTDVPSLTKGVQSRGIAFDAENHLTQILRAGLIGKRNADEMADLVLACLKACHGCRGRMLAPLPIADLKSLLQWRFPQEDIRAEARIRGIKDIEYTEKFRDGLRADVGEDLANFLVPDDRIPVAPLPGYAELLLKRADEYDAEAPSGWFTVSGEFPARSKNEFIFKHNRLFLKAAKEPKDLSCYFNKPTPRNTKAEYVDFDPHGDFTEDKTFIKKWDPRKNSKAAAKRVSYLIAGDDGRNAFRIDIDNPDRTPQRYLIRVTWRVRKTPENPGSN